MDYSLKGSIIVIRPGRQNPLLRHCTGGEFYFSHHGMLFSPRKIFRRVQEQGLVARYYEDNDFAISIKMFVSLTFVPEIDVIDCFIILMQQFPNEAIEIAKYFEDIYRKRRV